MVAEEVHPESSLSDNIKQSKFCNTLTAFFTMVAHFVCVLFSGYLIYTAKPGSSLFSWHPTLMTIAFMLLMAEAILIFSPQSSFFQKAARKTKVKYHWWVMVGSIVTALTGVLVIWYNKELNGSPHATSGHGKLGYITCIYIITQALGGSLHLYPKVASKFAKLATLKILHATSGLVAFMLVSATLALGMCSGWFTNEVTGTSWYACMACPAVLLVMIMTQVTNEYLGKNAPLAGKKAPLAGKR